MCMNAFSALFLALRVFLYGALAVELLSTGVYTAPFMFVYLLGWAIQLHWAKIIVQKLMARQRSND